jgi:DNA adenine methylase
MMGFGSNALCRGIQSGFRANSNRSGTTPAHDWKNYPECLRAIIERLQAVVIENRDAEGLILQHDSVETLHYCDPPYVHDTRSAKVHGHHGYSYEMTDAQHEQMAEVLDSLQGMVVISGYHSALYDRLFNGWNRLERLALADGARDRVEVLWFNEAAWVGKSQARLDF